MKNRWRSIFAMIIGGLLLVITNVPSDAARRVARGSSYDGTWSVAIYTLRGDCGSIRAALRIVGGRVYSEDQSYQAYGAVGSGGTIRVTLVRGGQSYAIDQRPSYTTAGRSPTPGPTRGTPRGSRPSEVITASISASL